MGFYNAGLVPAELAIVKQLQTEIVGTLRNAAAKTGKGMGKTACRRWFGDDSEAWMAELQTRLNTLAGMINVKQIAVSFSRLDGRCGKELADAMRSITGLPPNLAEAQNPMTTGENRNFRILLKDEWRQAPQYRPFKQPANSKFQMLVHECSHLFLDTEDDAYGIRLCQMIAADDPETAKITADNWGYFVEEFR